MYETPNRMYMYRNQKLDLRKALYRLAGTRDNHDNPTSYHYSHNGGMNGSDDPDGSFRNDRYERLYAGGQAQNRMDDMLSCYRKT